MVISGCQSLTTNTLVVCTRRVRRGSNMLLRRVSFSGCPCERPSCALLEYQSFRIPTLQYDLLDSDCCALSLQPFTNPVAVITEPSPTNPTPRADVFELMNIVPYIRKFKTNPVTGEPLDTSQLIKLNFFKVSR
jgi:hypothetical protein